MDTLKSHYGRLLGLDASWSVTSVDLKLADKQVVIALEYVDDQVTCPDCAARCPFQDHAPLRRWRHLDTMQFETVLEARVPRSHCDQCGVKTAAVPWAGKHSRFTLLFEAFAIDVLLASGSVQAASLLLGLGWETTHTIMKRAVQRGLAVRQLEGIRQLGLDEKSFGRGQDYVSVMTDPVESRVIDVVPGRTEESANSLWNTLTSPQRAQIEAVSIDMWQAFENSVRTQAPQADIVYDTFHIAKYLNEALDKVRREEHRELKAKGDDRLTGTRNLWLYHPDNLTEARDAELSALRKQQLRTARAWGIKDYFRWFWTYQDAESAETFFHEWYSWASRSRLKPIQKVAKMLRERLPNILTWFTHRISNSTSEGFNSRIQNLKSNARGFRNFDNYRTRILFFCGKLRLKTEIP